MSNRYSNLVGIQRIGLAVLDNKPFKQENKMKYQTDINIILDRSGSMSSMREAVISGFNKFIGEQKSLPESARISLYQFDDVYETVYNDRDIKEADELTTDTFVPRSMTALYDAIGKTINSVGFRLSNMKAEERPKQVLIVVITDGLENASKEFNFDGVDKMIKHQTEKYSWQFVYIGATLDAVKGGYAVKSLASNYASFNRTTRGGTELDPSQIACNSFSDLSEATTAYRGSGVACVMNYLDQFAPTNESWSVEAEKSVV